MRRIRRASFTHDADAAQLTADRDRLYAEADDEVARRVAYRAWEQRQPCGDCGALGPGHQVGCIWG